jgi:hypothetical protein
MLDLFEIIRKLTDPADGFLPQIIRMTSIIFFVIGVAFAIKGLMAAAKRQEMGAGQGSWGAPLMMFTTGVLFVAFPGLMNTLSLTFFSLATPPSAESIFSYSPATIGILNGAEARSLIVGITLIVQFVGVIAIARGLYLLNMSAQSAQGPKTFGPGLTFVIAGAMATNFPIFVGVMENLITVTP